MTGQLLMQNAEFSKRDLLLCTGFLKQIGIDCIIVPSIEDGFLPGLSIVNGKILIDESNLINPGDILHEAGHIAVVPAAERNSLTAQSISERPMREAEEMMAMAWSFAACVYLQLHPYFVFHGNGYKGGGQWIADNFMNDQFMGLPMLQWIGLTADEKNAAELGVEPYPFMIKWLRD